jgi:hypothetical protein
MLEYVSPSMTGRGLEPGVEDALSSMGGSLQYLVDEINWELDQLRNVQIPGQGSVSLQELFDGTAAWAEAMFLPSNSIVMYHGTWQDAAELAGWTICDGSNGSPQIHPPPSAASPVQRMVRATAFGTGSGDTAGTECHCHATCTAMACAGDHYRLNCDCACTTCDCHCHTLGAACACTCTDGCHCHDSGTLSACCNDCYGVQVCCGTDHCVSQNQHTHAVEGCTACNTHAHCVQGSTCCEDHCHGVQGATCCECHCHQVCGDTCCNGDHVHALSSTNTSCDAHLPQLIDVIFLMKL